MQHNHGRDTHRRCSLLQFISAEIAQDVSTGNHYGASRRVRIETNGTLARVIESVYVPARVVL